MAYCIFLSHSSADTELVRQLNADLIAAGIKTWFDEAEIRPGDQLMEKIQKAIQETELLGVVLTRRSVDSDWVQTEVLIAINQGVPNKTVKVVPLLLETCELPSYIANIKWVDLRGDSKLSYQKNLQLLVHFIRRFPNGEIEHEPSRREIFLEMLKPISPDAYAFDSDLTKADAERLAGKVLYDDHFDALHDLGARYMGGTVGITRNEAIAILERPGREQVREHDEATRIFQALVDDGFLSLSRDARQATHPDPGYVYTPLFFGFINLMRFLGIGELKADTDSIEFWLKSRGSPR
jgi:hypothetical protein